MKRTIRSGWVSISLGLLLVACQAAAPTASPAPPTGAVNTPAPTAAPEPTPAGEFNAEEYFRGQSIRFVISSSPGGGTDLMARVIGSHLGKFIPGEPSVISTNLERIASFNAAYSAPPDGFTVSANGGADGSIARQPLPESEYDMRNVKLIGGYAAEPTAVLALSSLAYTDIADLIAQGASGPGIRFAGAIDGPEGLRGTALALSWLCLRMDLPCQFLQVADDGNTTLFLMQERDEIDLVDAFLSTMIRLRGESLQDGSMKIFALLDAPEGTDLHLPDGVTAPADLGELIPESLQSEWTNMIVPASTSTFSKHYWVGPEVPDEVVNVLRQGFVDMMADEDIADSLELANGVALQLLDPEVAQEMLHQAANTFLDNQANILELQTELFDKYWK